jgi:signal transduction histidine kinase
VVTQRQTTLTPTSNTSSKPMVLLVEDEPTLSTLVGNLLDEAGYEHVSISDHRQISKAIARWRPRCVILDGDPGSRGHELSWADAAAIRRAHPELPVLMFTADPSALAEARAATTARSKAAGYAGVIDKPFLVVEFLATLKHAVDTPQPARGSTGLSPDAVKIFPDLDAPAAAEWSFADFFSTAVHELRTPLTSLEGQLQFAQRLVARDPARAAEALARAREQTQRMNRLIVDLLENARVSANALSLEVITFDLLTAIASTIALHEHEDSPRIAFTAPAPVHVRGDPGRIAQILSNLLDNALKYSPPGSAIEVALSGAGAEAQVRITDRGIGVPDEERGRLFAPFFRTSRTRDIAGTGLGLYISRRIAEQHRGRLWLESSSPRGSVFVLALPLAQD